MFFLLRRIFRTCNPQAKTSQKKKFSQSQDTLKKAMPVKQKKYKITIGQNKNQTKLCLKTLMKFYKPQLKNCVEEEEEISKENELLLNRNGKSNRVTPLIIQTIAKFGSIKNWTVFGFL